MCSFVHSKNTVGKKREIYGILVGQKTIGCMAGEGQRGPGHKMSQNVSISAHHFWVPSVASAEHLEKDGQVRSPVKTPFLTFYSWW